MSPWFDIINEMWFLGSFVAGLFIFHPSSFILTP